LASGDRDPLVGWLVSVAGVVATIVLAVVVLLLPGHGSSVLASLLSCWSSLRHGMTPTAESLSGLVGIVLLARLAVRLAVVSARRRRRVRDEHLAVLRIAARTKAGSPSTLWFDHDEPLAFSLAGTPGVVVATEGLDRHLTDVQVDAVLVHERAHLAGRNHLVVATDDAMSTIVPFLDASAVRICGVEAVRAALLGVSGTGAPGSALAMSRDSVEIRPVHLQQAGHRVHPQSGVLRPGGVALPLVVAVGPLVAVVLLTCS
jgi:Zn-dependent protease with chaperone function